MRHIQAGETMIPEFMPATRATRSISLRHGGWLLQTTALVPVAAARRPLRWLAWSIIGAGSLFATQAMAIDVANQTDWNTAVAAVAAAGANSTVTINITSGFALTSSLAQLQASNANVTVNITGNSQTINGASAFQGIQDNGANAPTVNISAAIRKNQPPAQETIEFQIRPLAPKGISTVLKRNHGFRRNIAEASSSSVGMVVSD